MRFNAHNYNRILKFYSLTFNNLLNGCQIPIILITLRRILITAKTTKACQRINYINDESKSFNVWRFWF